MSLREEVDEIREQYKEVHRSDLREGERVAITYWSAQSGNWIARQGEVSEVSRYGTNTRKFIVDAENGTSYKVDHHGNVYNAEGDQRRLSKGKCRIYMMEGLDLETWEKTEEIGSLYISREKGETFDCPFCGAENSASINSVNDDNITVSCGVCSGVDVISNRPVEVSLKVAR